MTKEDVKHRVIEIVADVLNVDTNQISRDSRFHRDLNFDSLDDVELVMQLEDNFEIAISDEEAERFETVGQTIDFIAEVIKSQSQRV